MALAWYVARTNPRAEYLARDQLEGKGIEYYFPVVSTQSPRQGREDAPLFPSYLFLRYDVESSESTSLRAMPGLTGLVTFDGVAPLVPDDVIVNLRQRVAEMNESGGVRSRFKTGDRVWVRWGSGDTEDLAEVLADTRSAQGRVSVLIEFLGRLVRGEVHRSNIRLADNAEASGHKYGNLSRRRTRGKGRWIEGFGSRAVTR